MQSSSSSETVIFRRRGQEGRQTNRNIKSDTTPGCLFTVVISSNHAGEIVVLLGKVALSRWPAGEEATEYVYEYN
jgi:D-serine deaminase-like pyridoxal phosphate-dependent protein